MNIKDLIVILLILSIIFWAIFHQMASKYINSNEILKKKIFGIDIYKNKSMDISNIELVITAVIMINVIDFFSRNSLEKFFKKRSFLIFSNINLKTSICIIDHHKKLWYYIKVSMFFMILIIIFTITVWNY
jgi:dipeptide/tripeptide permease